MTYRLDYLEFPSGDSGASARFFFKAFGWATTDYGPGYSGVEEAGIGIGIDGSEERVAAPMAVIRCADLDRAEQAVRAAGGVIVRPAYDFPGGRRFHFREPGGCELAVYVEA
jgi:predicted enzyme related to lactoylglutathione lyase